MYTVKPLSLCHWWPNLFSAGFRECCGDFLKEPTEGAERRGRDCRLETVDCRPIFPINRFPNQPLPQSTNAPINQSRSFLFSRRELREQMNHERHEIHENSRGNRRFHRWHR